MKVKVLVLTLKGQASRVEASALGHLAFEVLPLLKQFWKLWTINFSVEQNKLVEEKRRA